MSERILFSQLVALISATHETNKIRLGSGDLAWASEPFEFEGKGHHSLTIEFDRGACCGSKHPYLCMMLDDKREDYFFPEYVFRAYYYEGDNCNDQTRFFYKIMADQIEIIDDLGIVGHGAEIGRTSLTKLRPSEYRKMHVNAKGRRVLFSKGKWIYAEEEKC